MWKIARCQTSGTAIFWITNPKIRDLDPSQYLMAKDAPEDQAQRQRKITGKEIATMSSGDFMKEAKAPYRRLMGYVKPYKTRFILGIIFGVLAGTFNGLLLVVLRTVFTVVLPAAPSKTDQLTDTLDQMVQEHVVEESEIVKMRTEIADMSEVVGDIKPFEDFPFWQDAVIERPDVAADKQWIFVGIVCLSVPLLLLIRGLFTYFHQYCMLWINTRVLYNLRDEAYSSLINQSLTFYNKAKQGELLQGVFNQTRMAASAGTDLLSAFIKHPVSIVMIFGVLLCIDWKYTLGAMVVFPLCILPVSYISRKVRKAGAQEEEEAGAIMVIMQESFSGIRVVKSHGREEFERKKFNKGSQRMSEFIMRWRKAVEITGPLVETVASFGMALGLMYAFFQQIDAGKFLILNMGLMSIYPHAKALGRTQIMLQKCLMATSKVFSFIDAEKDVPDKEDAIILKDAKGSIQLEDVTFGYQKWNPVLKRVNLEFEPGKYYALVGESGSGKSTIMSMLMRFYDVDEGRIVLDGNDLRDYCQSSLRDQIGIVNQETFLFHDTIYNNIRYGKLDATQAEIEAAAELAYAHEFITEQENGYETELGDKGCTLSGGQQQRISIARAILRDAPILLLDEAYSSLDAESEKKIHLALEKLIQGKTVIAIAHRLSTILNADQIIVMSPGGNIVDQGTHEELLGRCENYQELYRLQFSSPDPLEEALEEDAAKADA